ncbi:Glu/Leu/Phe/Val dehydrogenase [candidate division CSSED10-310 bacterium]|uniref:Glutamate dehydrogenase n=1 Tax=candidate division CSSED10-310 bacterium TaxID=2855610 RepID=A0ABV6YYM3_UNCC1
MLWQNDKTRILCTVTHNSDLMGYVALDSSIRDRSTGGLRMHPEISAEEIRILAHNMTLKFGFLGLPQGGAKAGVLGDPEAPRAERRQQLVAFARAIRPLLQKRFFFPHADMGTDNEDIRYMLHQVGLRVMPRELRCTQSGYYTAVSVYVSICQATRHIGRTLAGLKVALEGFGKVGIPLASLLAANGALIVAVSTSRGALYNPQGFKLDNLLKCVAETGSNFVHHFPDGDRIDRAALLELPVDILCPCANYHSIKAHNAPHIQASIICAGANVPLTPDAEHILLEKNVLCLPDFVTNCGGVLGGTMEFASVQKDKIVKFMELHLGARISAILETADKQGRTPHDIALSLAREKFAQIHYYAQHQKPSDKLFQFCLNLYRRGIVPGSLVAPYALPYFERSLA